VLDQLIEEGLLDEGRYAEFYACSPGGQGLRAVADRPRTARARRPAEIVVATLAMLENDWLPKLRELHRKRFKSLYPADAAGRMQQTGYSPARLYPGSDQALFATD
jgi:regulatory protein